AGSLIIPAALGAATGAAAGVVGGGIVGALVGLDIPEEHAHIYERELKAGRVLVGVRAGDRMGEAAEILHRCGGRDPDALSAPAPTARPADLPLPPPSPVGPPPAADR